MYQWLLETLAPDAALITPNRRLARSLLEAYGDQQLRDGKTVWATPSIHAYPDWLNLLWDSCGTDDGLPTRLNGQQSQIVWEEAMRAAGCAANVPLPTVARLARNAWQRVSESGAGVRDIARTAISDDHRLYASAAGHYQAKLARNNWIDDAMLAGALLQLLNQGLVRGPSRLVLAGFDREPQALLSVLATLEEGGTTVRRISPAAHEYDKAVLGFADTESELRAAGAWARRRVDRQPSAKVAIVVPGLEHVSQMALRCVREGFVPGWQCASSGVARSVNASYGRRLSEYPAVAIALLALRWVVEDLSAREVAVLSQSLHIGALDRSVRARIDLKLRDLPERQWTPAVFAAAMRSIDPNNEALQVWLQQIARLGQWRRRIAAPARPSGWAESVTDILHSLGWPGEKLSSGCFQLVNRWRELLNEFARLGTVLDAMDAGRAIQRLHSIAAETVFQPEAAENAVQVLGPLEAAGSEFDAVWIAGLNADNWPGAGNPSPLLSRQLQREFDMPDATAEATLVASQKLLQRLLGAAPEITCSWSESVDGVEQSVSPLLQVKSGETEPREIDPGLFAANAANLTSLAVAPDSVPPLAGDPLFGGAGTLALQLDEPFRAFAAGRLGVQRIFPQAVGISAPLRGIMLHDALFRLYGDVHNSDALRAWDDAETRQRIEAAIDGASQGHARYADPVLSRLLRNETTRLQRLLWRFVELDRDRPWQSVEALEHGAEFSCEGVSLKLRIDRIDRLADAGLLIIDYKSGAQKKLLNKSGEVYEPQLFVYQMALNSPVEGVALANIDSRGIGFDGVGATFGPQETWLGVSDYMQAEITAACTDLSRGDVRLSVYRSAGADRSVDLLSRVAEFAHAD